MTTPLLNIVSAQPLNHYLIHLVFSDGIEQTIDFKPFLTHSIHPDIRHWLEPTAFATFRLEYGELIWGDYALCFPIIDLYYNNIEHHHNLKVAA